MIDYKFHNDPNTFSAADEDAVASFLYTHLEQYGDARPDIQKCIDYALQRNGRPGGAIFTAMSNNEMVGAVIVNKTGMQDYIPENILVYIATHNGYRGQGIGQRLMQMAIDNTEGNIALHVEPDNPARFLYEKFGFTNKYLEMRLNK